MVGHWSIQGGVQRDARAVGRFTTQELVDQRVRDARPSRLLIGPLAMTAPLSPSLIKRSYLRARAGPVPPEFQQLAQVPSAGEWFAYTDNPNTRRTYPKGLHELIAFVEIATPVEVRLVTRAHDNDGTLVRPIRSNRSAPSSDRSPVVAFKSCVATRRSSGYPAVRAGDGYDQSA